ncbi:hypothetical protein ScPMuIL_016640 [Solemya velum]
MTYMYLSKKQTDADDSVQHSAGISLQLQKLLKIKMDIKESCFVAVFLAMLLAAPTFSLPMSERQTETDDAHVDEKRPKYMDTRDLEGLTFKELVWVSLLKLADEGRVSSDMITPENEEMGKMVTPDKRVHLRLCVRQAGGHFIPYPCWGNRR